MTSKNIRVQNLTDNPVVYVIPEDHLRREYGPGEEKIVSEDELQKVFYQPGGATLLREYLSIKDKDFAVNVIGVDPEVYSHEYTWDEKKVDSVLLSEHIDVLHDALDFAPEGIVDMLVDRAVALRIPDVNKRNLISDYTGRDINSMINTKIELERAVQTDEPEHTAPRRRRVTDHENNDGDGDSLFNTPARRVQ